MMNTNDAGPEPLASEERPRFPALSILRMLWKRRWLVLSLWIIASTVAIAIVRALPGVYRAEAVILVDSQKIPENFVSPTVSGDVADRLALLTQSIMTSARLLQIISDFDLYRQERTRVTQEELLSRMRDDISVSFEKSWTGERSQSFRLGYQGRDPKVVAAVTNRLASLYVEENLRTREDQAEGTVDFLKRHLQQAKKSLDEQEQKVAAFKQAHNGVLPEQQDSLLGTLSSLSMQLEGVQTAVARAQENKLSLEAALSAAESSETALRASLKREFTASVQAGADAGMVLKPRSEVLREQLRQLRLRYSPEYPDVQVLERQLAEATREESEEADSALHQKSGATDSTAINSRTNARPAIVSPELLQLKERITSIRAQIEVANHQLESLEKERQQLALAISDCQARINKLPLVEQEMAALKRNYEESSNNYNSLLQKQLAAGIATDMERSQKSERFAVIDAARVPEKPVRPKRSLLAAGGCVASLILALLAGFMLELRKHTFLGEWELPAGTVVLGRVPFIRMAMPTASREP